MTIDELIEAKNELAMDIIALIQDFEVSTSVGARNVHLDIHPAMSFSSDAGPKTSVPSGMSCVIDLNM